MSLRGLTPKLGKGVFIAESAQVIGEVEIGDGSGVWFNAVIRGDGGPVKIGQATSIQDICVVHSDIGQPVSVGDGVTVGHHAVIHGCNVSSNCIIGIGARLLNSVSIGEWSIVGAGAVVTEGTRFPPHSVILGVPARVVRQSTSADEERITANAKDYIILKNWYLEASV